MTLHDARSRAYGNEKEVGEGIRASGVPRSDIFVGLDSPDMQRKPAAAVYTSA